MFRLSTLVIALSLLGGVPAKAAPALVKGFSLTEIGDHRYDASDDPTQKTEAQNMVDRLYDLGVRQINLSPRAVMRGPLSSELIPLTPIGAARAEERRAYLRLIRYIKGKGMTVGLRPMFFVVDNNGNTPYVEVMPNGTQKIWWHGNIQPQNPIAWFESYKVYLDAYLSIAALGRVDEFTIGAELYSMTVGIEDQWLANPYGFPRQWLDLLTYVRTKVPQGCRVMYDINFTDDRLESPNHIDEYGGEFARWRYRLVDLADPNNEHWRTLLEFWKGLDAIGIDMYRSLATENQPIPSQYPDLVSTLQSASDRFATQMDNVLFEIEGITHQRKDVILKEVGFRSVDKGFINPFVYAGNGRQTLNIMHQAAAYDAIFRSFFAPNWEWFRGAVFWDASVDATRHGPLDLGFSPIGKPETEAVIMRYFTP